MDEEVIIEKIKNGDRSQLAIIYRTYRSEFIAWITSHHQCSRDEAREVYQVSILALHENILSNKLSSLHSSIKTYLFAIGKNKFFEFRKAESRFDDAVEPETIEMEELETWESEDREAKLQVAEKSLEKLGDPCKTLLELYYFHDMSMDEIADKLNYKNRDTAKNLKCKCLNRLRNIFRGELDSVKINV